MKNIPEEMGKVLPRLTGHPCFGVNISLFWDFNMPEVITLKGVLASTMAPDH